MEDLIKFVQGLLPERIKPFVSALVAGIAIVLALAKLIDPLASLRRSRRRSLAAHERMEEATKETKFWETWFNTFQLVNPPEQIDIACARVRSELQTILQRMEEPAAPQRPGRWHVPGRNAVRSALLLYRPHGVAGWLFHVAFYVLLTLLFFYLIGVSIDPASGNVSWHYFVTHLSENLGPALVFLIPLVLLYLGAKRRERRQIQPADEARPAG